MLLSLKYDLLIRVEEEDVEVSLLKEVIYGGKFVDA